MTLIYPPLSGLQVDRYPDFVLHGLDYRFAGTLTIGGVHLYYVSVSFLHFHMLPLPAIDTHYRKTYLKVNRFPMVWKQ